MKLFIGTANRAKQIDIVRALEKSLAHYSQSCAFIFPQDLGLNEVPEETGTTFAENSALKAHFYFDHTHMPVITDDGGIMISILNNEPGVRSRRWPGYEATDEELVAYCLKRLEGNPSDEERGAIFQTCVTYYDGKHLIQEKGEIKGRIAHAPRPGKHVEGFPYRRLFIIGNGKYYNDLTPKEHEKYNHREAAIRNLFKNLIQQHILG